MAKKAGKKGVRAPRGFKKVVDCFGGVGCLWMRTTKTRVTVLNNADGTELRMTIAEWNDFCKQIRTRKIT